MRGIHTVGLAMLVVTLVASTTSAQSVAAPFGGDSLRNGADAGAGIDFLAGRTADGQPTTPRLSPSGGPSQKGVLPSLVLPQRGSLPALKAQDGASRDRRDSVWNGTLIGAGVGAGIGAAVGAIADALHH